MPRSSTFVDIYTQPVHHTVHILTPSSRLPIAFNISGLPDPRLIRRSVDVPAKVSPMPDKELIFYPESRTSETSESYHFPLRTGYIRLQVSSHLQAHSHPRYPLLRTLHLLRDLSREVSTLPPNNSHSRGRSHPPHPSLSPAMHLKESINLSFLKCNSLQLRMVLVPRSMAPGLIRSDHCRSLN